jgi:transcriptional regulator with XRE-family HTH domain
MNREVRRAIGERLRQSRLAAKLTQQDVAQRLQLKRQTISGWERGEAMPQLAEWYRLAPLLGQSLDYLVYNVRTVPVSQHAIMETIFGAAGVQPEGIFGEVDS